MVYLKQYSHKETVQTEPIPGSDQVQNSAGGYSFEVSPMQRLKRFLVLGSEGGSYYASEQQLIRENAKNIEDLIKTKGLEVVKIVTEVSEKGQAPKNDPALFVLALAMSIGDEETKRAATAVLPKVARIGTHLFHFVGFADNFRGWGRVLKTALQAWYKSKTDDKLAFQVIKYASRDGWSHRDIFRKIHIKTDNLSTNNLYKYITHPNDVDLLTLPGIVQASEELKRTDNKERVLELLQQYKLPLEIVPTEKRTKEVYEYVLPNLGITALIRTLGTLSKAEVLTKGRYDIIQPIVSRVTDVNELKKGRVHPIQILAARLTYAQGKGTRSKSKWEVVPEVVDALEDAFYLAFDAIEPANKRFLIGLDVSGSMSCYEVAGVLGLTPAMAAAAMLLVTYRTEPMCVPMAFADKFRELMFLTRKTTLDQALEGTKNLSFGGTDCALPMTYALEKGIEVDTFMVLTDSETWAGEVHPVQVLKKYRQKTGIPAKLVVVGMVSNGFTIADPNDNGMLDVVGFSTDTPALISDFAAGRM